MSLFLRESRRKTPVTVTLKENERFFGDSAAGMVRQQPPSQSSRPRVFPCASLSVKSEAVVLGPGTNAAHLYLLQAIKNPKATLRYFQHLLGKQGDNPHVALYQARFPEHELSFDPQRQTVRFQISP